MKKTALLIILALTTLVGTAQFGGGNCGGSGNGFPIDTTGWSGGGNGGGQGWDSTWIPGDTLGFPWDTTGWSGGGNCGGGSGNGFPWDTTGWSGGGNWGGGSGNGNGFPWDSTWVPGDSLGFPWDTTGWSGGGNCGGGSGWGNGFPGDSLWCPWDTTGWSGGGNCPWDTTGSGGTCPWDTTISSSGSSTINTFLSVDELAVIEEINLYPNPVANIINVEYTSTNNDIAELRIFSMNGKLVLFETLNISSGRITESFDISMLPSGIYILRLTNGTSGKEMKFVK